jgi:hypothetical protein
VDKVVVDEDDDIEDPESRKYFGMIAEDIAYVEDLEECLVGIHRAFSLESRSLDSVNGRGLDFEGGRVSNSVDHRCADKALLDLEIRAVL